MSQSEAQVEEAEVMGINYPFLVALFGHAILFIIVLFDLGTLPNLILFIIAGMCIASGYIMIKHTPILLSYANFFVAFFMFLQVIGACKTNCSGFESYASILTIPVNWLGFVFHTLAFVLGFFYYKTDINRGPYVALLYIGQGVSLFYASLMIFNLHWCPSCAASHLVMLSQAILLWRLREFKIDALHVCAVFGIAFGINAIFHHSTHEVRTSEEQLIGYLENYAEDKPIVIGVEITRDEMNKKKAQQNQTVDKAEQIVGDTVIYDPTADPKTQTPVNNERALNTWGSAEAPVTLKAYMSFSCAGCQKHWKIIANLAEQIDMKNMRVEFLLTWPRVPDKHYGSMCATYVAYTAGLISEEHLILVMDKLFSAEGIRLQNHIQEVLTKEAVDGVAPDQSIKKALETLFGFVSNDEAQKQLFFDAYNNKNIKIDNKIAQNTTWLLEYGRKGTPNYFYLLTKDRNKQPYNYNQSLDSDVIASFVKQGLTLLRQGE